MLAPHRFAGDFSLRFLLPPPKKVVQFADRVGACMGMLFQHDESGNAMLLPPILSWRIGGNKKPTNNHGKGSTNASRYQDADICF